MLTWLPWLHHFGWNMGAWWKNQVDSARFHRSGIDWTAPRPEDQLYTPTHPYYARAWKWIPDLRPTSFFVLNGENKLDIEQVLAIGNPIIFWASVVVIRGSA
jgi:hypothetical protein